MKVAFICPSLSRTSGGIFEITRFLSHSLAQLPDTILEVFGTEDEHLGADLPAWLPLQPRCFQFSGPSSFRYSPKLRRALMACTADIAHMHALWSYSSMIIRRWSDYSRKPYIITANGMLDSWALENSAWKKRIALRLYERKCLDGAACLQVNSAIEMKSVRDFGLTNPICIIPNGVDLPPIETARLQGDETTRLRDYETARPEIGNQGAELGGQSSVIRSLKRDGRKILLYLGRLHPKKGLTNLLRAWCTVQGAQRKDWFLVIAGWDQGGHETELKRLASELGIRWSDERGRAEIDSSRLTPCTLLFAGPQFGEDKAECFRSCDAFILPSFSEGLPMAVLEAWSYAKPVLMTPQCNLPEGFAAGAALRIEPNVESIAGGIIDLLHAPSSSLHVMGQNGRALVASRFTWPQIARDMRSVYDWALGCAPKPGCVTAL